MTLKIPMGKTSFPFRKKESKGKMECVGEDFGVPKEAWENVEE